MCLRVLVSSAVKDLMPASGIRFSDRGAHQLKGVPERWRLYRVEHAGMIRKNAKRISA